MYLEVARVDTQGEGMQLTQVQESGGQIVYFADGIGHPIHDSSSVLLDIFGTGTQWIPVAEVSLGLRVHHQQPRGVNNTGIKNQNQNQTNKQKTRKRQRLPSWSWTHLPRASAPMSSALLEALAQKALTTFLSSALRDMLIRWM